MSSEHGETLPHKWDDAQALFERLLESDDVANLLAQEPDQEVAALAERLLRDHHRAIQRAFLEEPITLVRNLVSDAPPRFQPGQILMARFAIERLLGRGGMGEVYLTQDRRLNERVAIKTIRAELAADIAIRRRFLSEVQNARRVTHPNVCRIFDLFDEADTPFFSMEYLPGTQLSEWIRTGRQERSLRHRVALQLAEGLAAAHRSGVIHADFKPANVILIGDPPHLRPAITDFGLARAFSDGTGLDGASTPERYSLRAGTLDYMAPELLKGSPPTIRTDIYAYGKVLAELLPGHRLVPLCIARLPANRLDSLEPVIRSLGGVLRRRVLWTLGALAPAAAIAGFELFKGKPVALAGRQRLAVNGFRPAEASRVSMARDLLITALRQSPLLSVVSDDHVRAALESLGARTHTPVNRGMLFAALARDGVALVLEGTLRETAAEMQLAVELFEREESRPLLGLRESAPKQNMVRLVDQIALRFRQDLGESAAALHSAYTPLERVTSAAPEAVEAYYQGLREYDSAKSNEAEAWFDEALRIDPQFALAHMERGNALASRFQAASALESYQRAFTMRNRVSERERLLIESCYYNIIGDFVLSLEACRHLVLLFPEEATFQRYTAFALVRVGRPMDALPYNQRAVALDSTSDNNLSELIVNHMEANRYDEALELYRKFRGEGHTSTLLNWGAGLAHLGKGDYEDARTVFEAMATAPERERWSRLLACEPLILEGRFTEAASRLASDLAYDIATGEENRRQIRRSWLGSLHWLMDSPEEARIQAEALAGLDPSPVWIEPIREGGVLALLIGAPELASTCLERLRSIERQWPSTHSRGVRAHIEGATLMQDDAQKAGDLLGEARGLWPDPLTLWSVCRWQMQQKDFVGALATLEVINQQRGRMLRRGFPGLTVLAWIDQARCLALMSRFGEALRVYERVLNCWHPNAAAFSLVRQLHLEYRKISNRRKGEENG